MLSRLEARNALKKKGWTYEKAALMLGVNFFHFANVMRGARESRSLLERVAALVESDQQPPKSSKSAVTGELAPRGLVVIGDSLRLGELKFPRSPICRPTKLSKLPLTGDAPPEAGLDPVAMSDCKPSEERNFLPKNPSEIAVVGVLAPQGLKPKEGSFF